MNEDKYLLYEERRKKLFDGRDMPGGWSKERLAEWGVPWPPPNGWSNQLVLYGWPYRDQSEAEAHGWFRVV